MAKEEIHSIHSYKGHTPGRPVDLKEILHSHGVTPWLLGSLAPEKGQYIQVYEDQVNEKLKSVVAPFPDKHSYEQRAKRPVSNILQ